MPPSSEPAVGARRQGAGQCCIETACLIELRWLYDRRNVEEARRDLTTWLTKWEKRYPKLCQWVEENIEKPHR